MRWLTLLLLVLVQCSSDPAADPIADRVCDPGKQDACPCPGGTEGAQSCNADGSGFNECQCETGGVGGSAGSGGPNGGSGGSGGGLSGVSGTAGNSATAGTVGTGGTGGISGSAGEAGMAGASGTAGVAGSGGIAGGAGGSANQCGDGPLMPVEINEAQCSPLNGPDNLSANNAGMWCNALCGFDVFAFNCPNGAAPSSDCTTTAELGSSGVSVACCPQTHCHRYGSVPECDGTSTPTSVFCAYGAQIDMAGCVEQTTPGYYCCPLRLRIFGRVFDTAKVFQNRAIRPRDGKLRRKRERWERKRWWKRN